MSRYDHPQVGVAMIVRKDNKILLHKRKGALADGYWAFPGGHLEKWEDWDECALRELKEEAGDLKVTEPKFWTAVNAKFRKESRHYATLFMLCDWIDGEAEVMEPDKCECWEWFSWDDLPDPLMAGIHTLINTGQDPFKAHSD